MCGGCSCYFSSFPSLQGRTPAFLRGIRGEARNNNNNNSRGKTVFGRGCARGYACSLAFRTCGGRRKCPSPTAAAVMLLCAVLFLSLSRFKSLPADSCRFRCFCFMAGSDCCFVFPLSVHGTRCTYLCFLFFAPFLFLPSWLDLLWRLRAHVRASRVRG